MNIALVTNSFTTGGGLEHLYQIAHAMPDYEFSIIAHGGDDTNKFDTLANVSLVPTGYGTAHIISNRPHIIHFHHIKPLVRYFINPFRPRHIPVIFTAHGLHIHKYNYMHGPSNILKKCMRAALEKFLYRCADHIVAVSQEDQTYIAERYRPRQVTYITNGIDTSSITQKTESNPRNRLLLGLPANGTIFLTVARFNFQKGYDILILAIQAGRDHFRKKNARFVLVGDGEEFETIKTEIVSRDIADLVICTGKRTDIYPLMQACDFFVLPSRWEGLPITLIEASLNRLPIIASNTCGNREIIREGENGILFRNLDPNDLCNKLVEVLDKTIKFHVTKKFYQKLLADYSVENMTAKLHNLYRSFTEELQRNDQDQQD